MILQFDLSALGVEVSFANRLMSLAVLQDFCEKPEFACEPRHAKGS